MFQGNIGDNSSLAYQVPIFVPPGQTVTVTNKAGATTSHKKDKNDNAAAGTLTPTQSVSYSQSFWLSTPGITTITLTGPGY